MNEFIVWDEEKQKFLKPVADFLRNRYETGRYTDIEVIGEMITSVVYGNNDDLLAYIGKTDIEGNKIYADCSIVEFDYARQIQSLKPVKMMGYFTYCNDTLGYRIKIEETRLPFALVKEFISNLKIIGTLQENPELLEVEV